MNDRLTIRTLAITQTKEFPQRPLPPMTFGEGLNIIYGPNASGKTTTARAIQTLLWPQSDIMGTVLAADVELNGKVEQYRCLAGVREGGTELHYLGDASDRYRYMLAQHELLTSSGVEKQFADSILQEARGGLDISGAVRELGYRKPNRGKTPADFREANREYQQARDAERRIRFIEDELGGLGRQLEEAKAAQQRLERFTLALEYHEKEGEEANAAAKLEQFPAVLADMSGREKEDLAGYDKEIAESDELIHDAERALAEAEELRRQSGLTELPAVELTEAAVSPLCDEIVNLDNLLGDKRKDHQRAESEAQSAYTNLGGQDASDYANPLPVGVVMELSAFVRRAEGLAERRQGLQEQLRWLDGMPAPQESPADSLREATKCLYQWLATREDTAQWPRTAGAIAGLLAAVMGLLALLLNHSLFGGLALLAGLAVGVFLLLAGRRGPAGVTRDELQNRFTAFRLDGPPAWASSDVEQFILDLQDRIASVELAKNARIKRNELQQELANEDTRAQALEPDAIRIADLLGVAPARVTDGDRGLWYFVDQLFTWQEKSTLAKCAKDELDTWERERQEKLAAVNARLAAFGYPPAAGSGEVRGLLKLLSERKTDYERAENDAKNARKGIADNEKRRDKFTRKRADMFARLGLDADPDAARRGLADLLDRLETYREAKKKYLDATAVKNETDRKGQQWPDWTELIAIDTEGLRKERDTVQEMAEKMADLSRQIGDSERQVKSAKDAAACEDAQAKMDNATNKLRRSLEETLRAGIGWKLASQLEAEMDAGLSDVFQRAQALFATFTNGRYDLRVDQAQKDFRAYDREDNVERGLDQLSSATRVQLLMAVRVAFVEKREQGPKLPLLMDETLACSDEQREHAIINAALEICRQGRQVFYFTSKPAEVARWEQHARQAGVEMTVVPLDKTPREKIILPAPIERASILDHGGMSHESYGEQLGVAQLDFRRDTAAQAHVWYVVEDNDALRKLLQSGITSCGQLSSPQLAPVVDLLLGAEQADKTYELARLLEKMHDLWWEGRGQPLNYQALQDSGILTTDSFTKEIPALAEGTAMGRERSACGAGRPSGQTSARRQHPKTACLLRRTRSPGRGRTAHRGHALRPPPRERDGRHHKAAHHRGGSSAVVCAGVRGCVGVMQISGNQGGGRCFVRRGLIK